MPNVLSPRDLVSRPDKMDGTVPHTTHLISAGTGNPTGTQSEPRVHVYAVV